MNKVATAFAIMILGLATPSFAEIDVALHLNADYYATNALNITIFENEETKNFQFDIGKYVDTSKAPSIEVVKIYPKSTLKEGSFYFKITNYSYRGTPYYFVKLILNYKKGSASLHFLERGFHETTSANCETKDTEFFYATNNMHLLWEISADASPNFCNGIASSEGEFKALTIYETKEPSEDVEVVHVALQYYSDYAHGGEHGIINFLKTRTAQQYVDAFNATQLYTPLFPHINAPYWWHEYYLVSCIAVLTEAGTTEAELLQSLIQNSIFKRFANNNFPALSSYQEGSYAWQIAALYYALLDQAPDPFVMDIALEYLRIGGSMDFISQYFIDLYRENQYN